jgi:hypothetical protein
MTEDRIIEIISGIVCKLCGAEMHVCTIHKTRCIHAYKMEAVAIMEEINAEKDTSHGNKREAE